MKKKIKDLKMEIGTSKTDVISWFEEPHREPKKANITNLKIQVKNRLEEEKSDIYALGYLYTEGCERKDLYCVKGKKKKGKIIIEVIKY